MSLLNCLENSHLEIAARLPGGEIYSDLSIFQNTGVAGPSSTPESDFRQALGTRNCPSGI